MELGGGMGILGEPDPGGRVGSCGRDEARQMPPMVAGMFPRMRVPAMVTGKKIHPSPGIAAHFPGSPGCFCPDWGAENFCLGCLFIWVIKMARAR